MPPQNIIPEPTLHYVDFGSDLSNFNKSNDDVVYDRVPGAWLGDSAHEEFSDPDMSRSKARAIAKDALADLQRAAVEAEDERLRRHTLRARLAAQDREQAIAAVKGDKKSFEHLMSIRAILAQDNATDAPTDASRRAATDLSLNSGGPYNKPSYAVAARGNASKTPRSASRRPHNGPSTTSGAQNASQAPTHAEGFLSLMDDFNARGGVHTAPARRLVDGGLISEGQLAAAAAARAKPRADERAVDEEVAHRDRLAAARAKLAAEGRVVPTVSEQASSSGSHSVKPVSPMPGRPGPARPCVTVGLSMLPTRKLKRCVPAGIVRSGFSTADEVKLPVRNSVVADLSPTDGSKPEIEAGRRSTGHSIYRTLPIYDLERTPKSSSTKPATAAASTTAIATARQSVSEKAQAIARRYACAAEVSSKPAQKAATQKLAQGADQIDPDAEKEPSTKHNAVTKVTGTTQCRAVSEKVQAILSYYGEAMSALDDASVAAFVAYKLEENTDHTEFGAENEPSTKLTVATKMLPNARTQSVDEKVQSILRCYAEAMSAFDEASVAASVAHKLKQDTNRADSDAGKKPSSPAQLKTQTTPNTQSPKGVAVKNEVAKTVGVDDGFDVVNSKGPSAANGSPLPDPDLKTGQLDVQFSPTLKGFQGWEDDYDSDDSEEWDLGGLAEWKWVGEKSAKESSAAKRQA